MIVVNKCVKSHNSLGMISKVTEIYNKPAPSSTEMTKLPRAMGNRPIYNEAYNSLFKPTPKRRDFGLSHKSFKTSMEYVHALKKAQDYDVKTKLNEFIKESVNGGMSFDQECVLI